MNKRFSHRSIAAIAGPIVAAGLLLGSVAIGGAPAAGAQPSSTGQCTSMPMTGGQSGPNPYVLTRAGQVAAANGPGASDGSMAAGCQPVGHS